MADFAAEGERSLAILPVARFRDGSTVYSVIIPGGDGIDHGYWVVRDGRVVAKCPSLAAVHQYLGSPEQLVQAGPA